MSTTDEGVCAALVKCPNFVKSVLAMLQSLIPELVHRALIIVLNVLSMDSTVSAHDAAVMLCEGQLLPVVSVVIEEMKGKTEELVFHHTDTFPITNEEMPILRLPFSQNVFHEFRSTFLLFCGPTQSSLFFL
jgi:hypothetical protein